MVRHRLSGAIVCQPEVYLSVRSRVGSFNLIIAFSVRPSGASSLSPTF